MRTRSVDTQLWLDNKADQSEKKEVEWQASGGLIRSDVELFTTDCTVNKQPHEYSRGGFIYSKYNTVILPM